MNQFELEAFKKELEANLRKAQQKRIEARNRLIKELEKGAKVDEDHQSAQIIGLKMDLGLGLTQTDHKLLDTYCQQ